MGWVNCPWIERSIFWWNWNSGNPSNSLLSERDLCPFAIPIGWDVAGLSTSADSFPSSKSSSIPVVALSSLSAPTLLSVCLYAPTFTLCRLVPRMEFTSLRSFQLNLISTSHWLLKKPSLLLSGPKFLKKSIMPLLEIRYGNWYPYLLIGEVWAVSGFSSLNDMLMAL